MNHKSGYKLNRFTPEEDATIREMLEGYHTTNEIAIALGRTHGVTSQRILHYHKASDLRDPKLTAKIAYIRRMDETAGEAIRMISEYRGKEQGWAAVKLWEKDRDEQRAREAQREKDEAEARRQAKRALNKKTQAMVRDAEQTLFPSLDRDQEMAWLRLKAGLTLQSIGDRYHLTRERVRQIVKKTPLSPVALRWEKESEAA